MSWLAILATNLILFLPNGGDAKAAKITSVTPSIPPLLEAVEKKYTNAKTLQANFTQTNVNKALDRTEKSSGVIKAKRPGMIRWETKQPEENLLVSDGKTYWIYTPPFDEEDRGQVVIQEASKVQSKLANLLLSGRFSMAKDMRIQQKTLSRFILTPKRGTSGTVERAEIQVDPDKKLIQRIVLQHQGGNRSEIFLSEIRLGEKIAAQEFQFKAPANTDQIHPGTE